uniref:non-specific serine/threonine protein kinase n=1 Tax=Aegilops tauschii subsp. strangulata TaxID=200361 RepID=A0A453QL72_AEGTS
MPLERFYLVALLLLLVAAGRGLTATVGADDGRQFAYNGFAGRGLDLDGAAEVTPNGLLMLTNGTIQQKGHAFHPSPVPLRAARSFSTAFVFAIFGQYIDLSSPGMAFFVTTSKEVLATALPGQFLGLLNATNNTNPNAHIFAVELDTLLNSECRDMNSNHVGVDLDSMVSRASADAGYYDDATGRFQNLSLISRQAMQVWVDYDGAATEITVTMAPLGVARPKTPLLRTAVNLSAVVQQQDTAYVGFSSATGILFARHFVVGWSFALDGPAPTLNISSLPALPPTGPKPRSRVLEIVLPIASATVVLAVGIAAYIIVRRRLRYAEVREDWEVAFGPQPFSYKDLYQATKGFSETNLLGAGGFGSVYKGVLRKPDMDTEVAVKRVSHQSRQGMKEFVAEVASMRRLHHRNLVQLLGYCRRKGELLLVYDHMPNGSLDKPIEEDEGNNRVMLVDWVAEHWRQGCITNAADIRMPNNFSLDEVSLVLKLGLLCSHPLSNARPTMRQVMQYLDDDMPLPEFSSEYLGSTMLELMYSAEFFNKNVTSYVGVISDLSGGR